MDAPKNEIRPFIFSESMPPKFRAQNFVPLDASTGMLAKRACPKLVA